jgi:hypothetical protein
LFLIFFIISFVYKNPHRIKTNLLSLILLGFCIQLVFGFIENRGIDAIREKMIITGHSEFARVAVEQKSLINVLYNYEQLIQENKLGKFPKSKPPGTLLTYMVIERISNIFIPNADEQQRFQNLTTFSSYLFPFLTYLVLIPLYFFSRRFLGKRESFYPCIIYLFLPNVVLIVMHLDQALYPLLFMICIACSAYAVNNNNYILSFLTGVLIYFSLFISFSLLPVIPLVFFVLFIFHQKKDSQKKSYITLSKHILALLGGFILIMILFYLLFNYNFITRYNNALLFHEQWKVWTPQPKRVVYFAFLNYFEYGICLGITAALIYLLSTIKTIREACLYSYNQIKNYFRKIIPEKNEVSKYKPNSIALLSISLVIIFVLLGIFGKTKGETARLWLFLSPLICLIVTNEIIKRFGEKSYSVLKILILLQFITIIAFKINMDFYHYD